MMYEKQVNAVLPVLTAEEIKQRADEALLNGVGLAIAQAGPTRVAELCQLIGCLQDHSNVLGSVQNILATFNRMHVRMDLHDDRTFSVSLQFDIDDAPGMGTLQ